jgi:hypothetical protein
MKYINITKIPITHSLSINTMSKTSRMHRSQEKEKKGTNRKQIPHRDDGTLATTSL